MEVSLLLERSMLSKLLQSENAEAPMEVRLAGRSILSKLLHQANALYPTFFIPVPNLTLVRLIQL